MKAKNGLDEFQEQISRKEQLKIKAGRQKKQSVWTGFSVFGLIGWSVAVPTVLLVLFGMWLDKRYDAERSYTLPLLIAGLCIGCLNAWYWVDKKIKELQEEEPKTEDDD
jgi:ATP synthase protein I